MTGSKDYRLYGLRVRSEVDLPELPVAPAGEEPDVTISRGPVECSGKSGEMHVAGDRATFAVPGTARYSICRGTAIVVDPEAGAPARNVRLFLLGSAMGMLVHQRGLLPLHANTIKVGDKAIVFMGHSGAGKSSLAAWFHDLGHVVLGDDVCVVRVDGQRPTVSAGLPRLRLWKNTLEATGRDHSAYPLSYTGEEGFDKYDVTLGGQPPPQGEIELAGIYSLARGERVEIRRLTGIEAAEAVIANTYRGEYVAMVGNARSHWEACARLVQRTPVHRLERPWDLGIGAQVTQEILDHCAGYDPATRQAGG